jgi:hypothetical protein
LAPADGEPLIHKRFNAAMAWLSHPGRTNGISAAGPQNRRGCFFGDSM